MEDLGQDFGYTLYRTTLNGPTGKVQLILRNVHDRALVYLDGKYLGMVERSQKEDLMFIDLGFNESKTLDILVENMGRVNYGPKLRDRKGIRGVRFGLQYHFGWQMFPLPMSDLSSLKFESAEESNISGPVFLKGSLKIDREPNDTFLRLDGFRKGFVVVNGHNIGRYFNPAGPQKTLYVPAPYLKSGENEIIVFESDEVTSAYVEFVNEAILG
jgi:beta-galactosidase